MIMGAWGGSGRVYGELGVSQWISAVAMRLDMVWRSGG